MGAIGREIDTLTRIESVKTRRGDATICWYWRRSHNHILWTDSRKPVRFWRLFRKPPARGSIPFAGFVPCRRFGDIFVSPIAGLSISPSLPIAAFWMPDSRWEYLCRSWNLVPDRSAFLAILAKLCVRVPGSMGFPSMLLNTRSSSMSGIPSSKRSPSFCVLYCRRKSASPGVMSTFRLECSGLGFLKMQTPRRL